MFWGTITFLLIVIAVIWCLTAGVALIFGGILRGIFGDSIDTPPTKKK